MSGAAWTSASGWTGGLVAREAGSADQAHLIRDFHQFTGTTATAYVARALPADPPGQQQVNPVQDALAAAF